MYQVSLLSSDVGKSSDLLGGKGDSANKNQANGNTFSDAMEQHYPNKNTTEADAKKSTGGNLEPTAAEQPPLIEKNGTAIKRIRHDLKDAHTLPVPLPVEDESSIVGSTSVVKSTTLPVSFVIDNEAMSAKLKAEKAINDDAHTLPVPLPIDDESLVTHSLAENAYITPVTAEEKTLISAEESTVDPVINKKANEHTLPVPVAPTHDKNNSLIANEARLNGASSAVSSDKVALASSSQQEVKASLNGGQAVAQSAGQNVSVGTEKSAEHDETVDLLKMLSGAQKLLTKSAQATSVENSVNSGIEKSIDNTEIKPNTQQNVSGTTTKTSAESLQDKRIEAGKNTTFTSAIDTKMAANHKLNDQASNANSTASTEKMTTPSEIDEMANLIDPTKNVKNKLVANNDITNEKSVVKNLSNNDINANNDNATKALELAQSQENAMHEFSEHKKALAADQSTEKLTNIKGDTTADEDTKKSPETQTVVNKVSAAEANESKLQVAELKKEANAGDSAQRPQVNQSTATVIPTSSIDKNADGSPKNTVIDEVTKLANTSDEAQATLKSTDDKKANQTEKAISAFNPVINHSINAQAAKSITSAAELNAHQEQSFENTLNQLNTNTVQTQKSITAINTETIAIYRKDFANAVKDKVMVMINQKIQQVEIQLDPPEMGNIHVKVNLQNEQAAVQFVVQNQQAKDALEQNMNKLRDMLAQNGVDVGDANIEQRQGSEQNEQGFKQTANNDTNGESAEDNFSGNDTTVLDVVKASSTGVDYYA